MRSFQGEQEYQRRLQKKGSEGNNIIVKKYYNLLHYDKS